MSTASGENRRCRCTGGCSGRTAVVMAVGANLGLHTVAPAKLAGSGRVICFEPQRVIFDTLCGSLALNNLTKVDAERVDGRRARRNRRHRDHRLRRAVELRGVFSCGRLQQRRRRFHGKLSSEPTAVVALDEFPNWQASEHLDLMKIDAEGFELAVLRNADRHSSRVPSAWCSLKTTTQPIATI